MPTLALDATYAADPEPTGTGVYSARLIAALAALSVSSGAFLPEDSCRLTLCFRPGPYLRWARRQKWPPGCSLQPLYEPFFCPRRVALFHGLNQRLLRRRYPAEVVTVHDVFPVSSPDYSTPQFQERFTEILRHAVRHATRIIAVSHATREQLLRHTGAAEAQLRVVHHGVDPPQPASQEEKGAFRRALGFTADEPFFLNVGAIQARKNVSNIVLALRQVPGCRLVLAGGDGFGAQQTHALIAREGLSGRVTVLGHAPYASLRLLYSTATALVFPSLEEGFGLPILEAMSYGLPVITSNCSSMPEVGGEAALYVDPRSPEEIAAAMQRVAEDAELARDLSRKGRERAALFSWERCARETLQVYREALGW